MELDLVYCSLLIAACALAKSNSFAFVGVLSLYVCFGLDGWALSDLGLIEDSYLVSAFDCGDVRCSVMKEFE